LDGQKRDNESSQGQFQLGAPVRLMTIGLDPKSASDLAEFAASTPLVRLQAGLIDYLSEDRDLPEQWTGNSQFDICVLDFDADRNRARITAEKIHADLPDIALFAVSKDSQPDLIIQAMRYGCSEYLLKPLSNDQLLQSIARVAARKRESQTIGRLIVLLGAKGGAGVTMIATHLGAILAKTYKRRTLLIDMHPSMGDAELYLGLIKYQYSFRDLAENADRLDREFLQSFALHHRSGLDLLPAPAFSQSVRRVSLENIGATLDFLRYCYEVLLVDCPPGMSEETQQAIRRADQVCLVAVPEVATLRNVARCLDHLVRINYPREKVGVVINRWTKRHSITDQQIEEAIRAPILWKLPNQYLEVIRIINDGDPSSNSGDSELSRSFDGLARSLASAPEAKKNAPKASRGLLGLFGADAAVSRRQ